MRITSKILSIPPYISTNWTNIAALHVEHSVLVIGLMNGSRIEIPQLDSPIIEAIFAAHEKHMEQEPSSVQQKNQLKPHNAMPSLENDPILSIGMNLGAFNMGSGGGLENLGSALQHDSNQAHAPNLPQEILTKIAALSKVVGINDPNLLPKAEPHCNCMHCQIARTIHGVALPEESPQILIEEEVSAEDLKFRLWDINPTGDQVYIVTNPSDSQECYSVYLGEPVGCTCGQKHCEHIRAVLNS